VVQWVVEVHHLVEVVHHLVVEVHHLRVVAVVECLISVAL
jgi:hypothetical protein